MKPATLAAYALCLAGCAFLGYYELHTDDTGVEVFAILLIAFALGALEPVRPWQWGLLVAASIPAAELMFRAAPQRPAGLALVTVVVALIALAGSYAGAWLRGTV